MLYPCYARVIKDVEQPARGGRSTIVVARESHCVKVIAATDDGSYVVRHPNDTVYPPLSILKADELKFGE